MQAGEAVGDDQFAALDLVAHHHGGHEGEAAGFAGEEAEGGHVVHLGEEAGVDAGPGEEAVEALADVALVAGEEEGDVVEIARKTQAAGFPLGRGDQGDRLLFEEVVVPGVGGIAAHGLVGEEEVHLMGVEQIEQIAERGGAGDDFQALAAEGGTEEGEEEVAGEGGDDADAQDAAAGEGTVFHDVEQLLAGPADGVGVVEGEAARLGEAESGRGAFEKGVAEVFLQLAELDADGGGREVEPGGGAGEVKLLRHDSEVGEMVVVEEGHGGRRAGGW